MNIGAEGACPHAAHRGQVEESGRAPHAALIGAAALVLEGFASLAFQMLILRALTPYVGSGVPAVSVTIAIFLAALAAGYERGGRLSEREGAIASLGARLLLAGGWIALLLSSPWLTAFFHAFAYPLGLTPLAALALYALLCVAPPVFWLGQTLPVLGTELRERGLGRTAGRALFLSTLGSFAGGLGTALWLIPALGLGGAVMVCVAAILVIAAYALGRGGYGRAPVAAITLAILAVSAIANPLAEAWRYLDVSGYAHYNVVDAADGGARELYLNHAPSSLARGADGDEGYPYIERMERWIYGVNGIEAPVLVLGAGGFTFGRGQSGAESPVFVDIDPALPDIAREHFLNGSIRGEAVVDDARRFLVHDDRRWPAIAIDTFSAWSEAPGHLLTREFFAQVRGALQPEGIVAINTVIDPAYRDPFSQRLDATIQRTLGPCLVEAEDAQRRRTNVLYLCQPRGERTAYRDRGADPGVDRPNPFAIYADRSREE